MGLCAVGDAARHGAGGGAHAARSWGARSPAWLAWLIVFNVVVFGWILFRAESLELAATFIGQLFDPGPATLWAPVTVAAIALVVGCQLLPPDPVERLRERAAGLPRRRSAWLAFVVAVGGATVPSGRAPVHLLPVLRRGEPPYYDEPRAAVPPAPPRTTPRASMR